MEIYYAYIIEGLILFLQGMLLMVAMRSADPYYGDNRRGPNLVGVISLCLWLLFLVVLAAEYQNVS